MEYFNNVSSYSNSPAKVKDNHNKKSYSPQNKINHIPYRDKFDSPRRPSLFAKLGKDVIQNQVKAPEISSNNLEQVQQKIMELPTNFKKNNLMSFSNDNIYSSNEKSPRNYYDKENEIMSNPNRINKKSLEFNFQYKKSNKKKNKNYSTNQDRSSDYQTINNQSLNNNEEEENYIKYIADQSISYSILNIGENLIDLYFGIDSRHNTLIFSKKYLNLIKEEILEKSLSLELFNNMTMNKSFTNAIKLSVILIVIIKYIIIDFQYENNIKSLLKKALRSLCDILVNSIDILILNPILSVDNSVNHTTLEKFAKFFKPNKLNHKMTISELLTYYNKCNEMTINLMKQISTTYFKVGFFRPIHNIVINYVTNLDKNYLINIVKLIVFNILFAYITPSFQNQNTKHLYNIPSYSQNLYSYLPSTPFLPSIKDYTYTLVLDLDETLVHFFYTPTGGSFLIRPYCMEFLEMLSSLYEIVIFTAAMKDYADSILDILDKDFSYIKHRLYRNHTVMMNNGVVKVIFFTIRDLSKLGRDLSKVIIIDNLPENFRMQVNNGLPIITWTDNMRDTQLKDLSIILTDISKYKVSDVRTVIKKLKEEILKAKNVNNPYFKIDVSKLL